MAEDLKKENLHAVRGDLKATVHFIEAWFQKHFGHVTPGTPEHAVVTAAKNDLLPPNPPAASPAA